MRTSNRRRGALAAIALTATLAATSACMSSSGTTSVTIATTGGNLGKFMDSSTFGPLEKSDGITVKQESPNNPAKLKAMVESGNPTWDAFYSGPYRAIADCGTMYEKIDYSIVDKSRVDADAATECGVPYMKSAFVIVYNKDKYGDNPPKTWADFYDNKKFPGKRGIMNFAKDAGIETALLGDGVKPENLYPLDYDRAFKKLDTIREDIVFFSTGAQQQQALESGQVDMMLAWPGRAYDAKKNGANLGVSWNQALHYYDVLTVVKGTKNKDAAMKVVNAMIAEGPQAKLAETLPYTPANPAADKAANPSKALEEWMPGRNKDGTEVERDNDWWAENVEEATAKWTKWVNS